MPPDIHELARDVSKVEQEVQQLHVQVGHFTDMASEIKDDIRKLSAQSQDRSLDIRTMQEQIKNSQALIQEFITRAEFAPVKMIAYGLATAVMTSVLLAVISKVLIK